MKKRDKKKPQFKKTRYLPSAIGFLFALLGAIATVLALLPKVTIDSSVPVDPTNPFSASFTIINSGYIPLWSTDVSIGIGQVVFEPAQVDPNLFPKFENRFTPPEWLNHRLSSDERFTVTIGDIFQMGHGVRLSGADIVISISYKPWILPFRSETVLRFITKKQSDGRLYWYSLPLH